LVAHRPAARFPRTATARRQRINAEQYFDGVPTSVWTFYIGGYQPAQKWLKDRTGRTLSYEDLMHYQRIVKALGMTNHIMKEL
jgi:hypothetical protein